MDFVVRSGAESIVAGGEPLQACKGKPAVRFLQVRNVLGSPGGKILLPRRFLRPDRGGRDRECKQQRDCCGEALGAHLESIVGEAACE
jgi:hypothetical protein